MSFDMSTLFAIVVFTSATGGFLLLVSWLQHRDTTALAYWGASFLLSALSAALIAARGEIANTWSIVVANAILVLGHGVLWSGTRNFEGRPISVLGTLAGPVIWLGACTLSFIYDSPAARATVITPILGVYLLLAAFELWRGRGDALTSRWPFWPYWGSPVPQRQEIRCHSKAAWMELLPSLR